LTKKNWAALTWDDLDEWAGPRSVSRGQAYQRGGSVSDLVISKDGRLLANVTGGDDYVVSVWLDQKRKRGSIHSQCTCPVGVACKHAIAVVAEYLAMAAKNKKVPVASETDPRWEQLEVEDMDSAFEDDDDAGEEESGSKVVEKSGRMASRGGSRRKLDEKIQQHIRAKSQEELAELVWSLTQRFPQLHEEFRERIALGEGNVDRLVAEARRELHRITASPGWVNSWNGEGSVPDYTPLIHRLERLVLSGHADAVVQLGREIITTGIQHAGESNDEGETGMAFAECLPVIFEAVAQSSLSPSEKLLFAIDAELEDDYDLIGAEADEITSEYGNPAAWSEVADVLARRLGKEPVTKDGDTFSRNYQRDKLSNFLGGALVQANRGKEALKLYEQEARKTGSYERLVRSLLEHKRYDEAQRWAREGIEKTATKLPGIAAHLAQALSDLAKAQNRHDEVAAHAACQFFEQPSQKGFAQLVQAATQAGCQDKVSEFALHFLATGVSPVRNQEWPLPTLDYLQPMMLRAGGYQQKGPHYGVLIDIAIAEKRPEEALHWYDALAADQPNHGGIGRWSPLADYGNRVAEAVAKSHPERALEIYHRRVSENLVEAKKHAYEAVIAYLRKMRPIMKALDRENGWRQLVADIRLRHRNRPTFVEMLDRLGTGSILENQKARR